jgi:gamma-glutamyl-gamma-aminobutyrate hydrolase PuuD
MPTELLKDDDVTSLEQIIEKYIEKQIELKLNSLLETLPDKIPKDLQIKPIYNLTIKELYKNTLQTLIDIINDIVDAYSNDDYIMALRHKSLPIFGVQFHPESYLSPEGYHLLEPSSDTFLGR